MQLQIKQMTNEVDIRYEDFLLEDELHYSIDGVSMHLSEKTDNRIDFNHDKLLPSVFNGDKEKFRIAIHTLLDFSVKYCTEGNIEVSTMFEGKTNNNNYLIKFLFTMPFNKEFDEELLVQLLNESN